MPYYIDMPIKQRQLLNGIVATLSRNLRIRLYASYNSTLRNCSDEFRADRRIAPGSPFFVYQLILLEGARAHSFSFTVDDSRAAAGVLFIAYIDYRAG